MAEQTATTAPYPDDNQGPLLLRTVWGLISLATLVVCGRIYTKLLKTRRLYWDDACIIVALVFGLVHAVTITRAVHTGLGRHLLYLTEKQREDTLRVGFFTLGWAFLSPMAGRVGFCVTLLYLAGTDPRVKKWPIWVFLVLQLAVNVSVVLVFYTQCGPELDIMWDPAKEDMYNKKCEDPKVQTDYGYFQGSFNTLTDAFLTALPALLIEHTRLSLRTKIGLAFLLCLSILAMIASIVKTYQAKALSEVLDYTYDLCPYVIWLSVELNVVIIVSSIPLLRPMFRRNHQRRPDAQQMQRWDSSTIGSVFSKKGVRTNLARVDSEENIIQSPQGHHNSMRLPELEDPGITVMTEVSVTYQTSDMPFVHAALVGLVQGEIANPRLAR